MTSLEKKDLSREVRTFATNLTTVLAGALPSIGDEPLRILLDDAGRHITVRQRDPQGIALYVNESRVLNLKISFRCTWNSAMEFLSVDECSYVVLPVKLTEPLFRYHYRRKPVGALPSAHLHVHGHRDETLALMLGGREAGRVRDRLRSIGSGKFPRLSALHFPLGGRRFRPGLEDVIDMLRAEFEIDVMDSADDALRTGRLAYRQMQLASAIGDDPLTAAAELERLGYQVRPPDAGQMIEEPRF